tara:strand:+ start:1380 stop:2435 length:1056 start_codon:yes stop_codon:yes gene_type:complete
MKILITGGAGFIGGNLAVYFAERNHEIVCFDNLVRRGSELNLQRFKRYKNITYIHGDVRNSEDLNAIPFSPDVVLECAAQPTAIDGYQNPMYDITNNTYGLINVLEYCRRETAALVFWTSNKTYSGDLCNSVPFKEQDTRLVWDNSTDFNLRGWSIHGFNTDMDLNGNQHTVYGASKIAADIFCQEWAGAFNLPVIINRFSCIYGPHQFGKVSQGWIVWFIIAKLLNKPITFYGFGGKQVRDCLYIEDMCELVEKQINSISNHYGSYYNVGGGTDNTTSILELNTKLDKMLGTTSEINLGAPRKADQEIYISDIRKAKEDFDWKPKTSFDEGLVKTAEWVKSNIQELSKFM